MIFWVKEYNKTGEIFDKWSDNLLTHRGTQNAEYGYVHVVYIAKCIPFPRKWLRLFFLLFGSIYVS